MRCLTGFRVELIQYILFGFMSKSKIRILLFSLRAFKLLKLTFSKITLKKKKLIENYWKSHHSAVFIGNSALSIMLSNVKELNY